MIKVTNDFGHGGSDPGAVSIVVEKDGVLRCGKALTDSLIRNGFAVKETRSGDTFVSLDDRVRISDNFGSDWFISNHEDAGGGHGITVYCYKFGGKGEILAKAVLAELVAATGMPGRGVKEGNFQVIRNTKAPGILIEFGFVDNADDSNIIKRADIPAIYGDAVTKALCSVNNMAFVPQGGNTVGVNTDPAYVAKLQQSESDLRAYSQKLEQQVRDLQNYAHAVENERDAARAQLATAQGSIPADVQAWIAATKKLLG